MTVDCDIDPFDAYTSSSLPNPPNACDYTKYQLWLPLRFHHERFHLLDTFSAFFIKVRFPADGVVYRTRAWSIIADPDHDPRLINQPYGSREECNDNTANGQRDSAVCIEVRSPTQSHCSLFMSNDIDENFVRIEVDVTSHPNMSVAEVNSDILAYYRSDIIQGVGQRTFAMDMQNDNYGSVFGIYRGDGATFDLAKQSALRHCQNSADDDESEPSFTNPSDFAVRFAG